MRNKVRGLPSSAYKSNRNQSTMKFVITTLFLVTVSGNMQNWRADIGFQLRADYCFVKMLNEVDFFSRGPIKLIYTSEAFLLKNGMQKGDRCEEFRYLGKRIVERTERQPILALKVKNVKKIVDQALQACANCNPMFTNTSVVDPASTTFTPAISSIQYPAAIQPYPPATMNPTSAMALVGPPRSQPSATSSIISINGVASNGTTSTISIIPNISPELGNAMVTTIVSSTLDAKPSKPLATANNFRASTATSYHTNAPSTKATAAAEDAAETISTDTASVQSTYLI
ncbi:cell wall integrity and stress response component 4-like [Varroa destructor]|uniref:Uncharacterized protein n=1 Tax=Varroa destructor TaxID=109461 RepID=A0A7M7JBK7_VARDE|nr:cell wall integrity and stress response component 4-like [Varroa destructor]